MTEENRKLAALKRGPSYEFSGNKNPKCPHCGEDFDVAYNEAWQLYNENDTHIVECLRCNNEFQVTSNASWSFSTDEQESDDD